MMFKIHQRNKNLINRIFLIFVFEYTVGLLLLFINYLDENYLDLLCVETNLFQYNMNWDRVNEEVFHYWGQLRFKIPIYDLNLVLLN